MHIIHTPKSGGELPLLKQAPGKTLVGLRYSLLLISKIMGGGCGCLLSGMKKR